MIKSMKNFFNESLLNARIANSQDLEYDNKNLQALDLLNKYEHISKKLNNPIYYLIRARLKHKLGKYKEALQDVFLANNYIENSKEINNQYLKKYVLFILKNIYYSMGDNCWEDYEKRYYDIIDDNSYIDPLWLQWLPLPSEKK